jgi:hypothetical protein
VREDGGDGEASGALDVHEEGSRGGHEGLVLLEFCRHENIVDASYLELVLLGLGGRGRVQKINGENLKRRRVSQLVPSSCVYPLRVQSIIHCAIDVVLHQIDTFATGSKIFSRSMLSTSFTHVVVVHPSPIVGPS